MDEKLIFEIVKIVKKSKTLVLYTFEDKNLKTSYVDFDSVLDDIQKYVKRLGKAILKESDSFSRSYNSDEKMIKTIDSSFDKINMELENLMGIYKEIKSEISNDNIKALLAFQVIQKVLYDYILWCDKLENAIFDISDSKEIIFSPNIDIEGEIINFVSHNTKSNDTNCFLPFLGGLGLGFLLDD